MLWVKPTASGLAENGKNYMKQLDKSESKCMKLFRTQDNNNKNSNQRRETAQKDLEITTSDGNLAPSQAEQKTQSAWSSHTWNSFVTLVSSTCEHPRISQTESA